MQRYQIGQLSRLSAVPVSTIRFYERAGLITPELRTAARYRLYTRQSLERLKFIRAAQGGGLSLGDIRKLLDLAASGDSPCESVTALMRRRFDLINRRIRELQRAAKVLAGAVERCCAGDDLCSQAYRLTGVSVSGCAVGRRR